MGDEDLSLWDMNTEQVLYQSTPEVDQKYVRHVLCGDVAIIISFSLYCTNLPIFQNMWHMVLSLLGRGSQVSRGVVVRCGVGCCGCCSINSLHPPRTTIVRVLNCDIRKSAKYSNGFNGEKNESNDDILIAKK